MAFYEDAEVEQRAGEQAPVFEQEGDEQAPDASIAVEVGVNRFKLDVDESGADEGREFVGGVDVGFEVGE